MSRVLTLLAAMGKLGRLASLGGRPQTLSSGCGMSSIQWPWVEVLQPGAHRTLKREGKAAADCSGNLPRRLLALAALPRSQELTAVSRRVAWAVRTAQKGPGPGDAKWQRSPPSHFNSETFQ